MTAFDEADGMCQPVAELCNGQRIGNACDGSVERSIDAVFRRVQVQAGMVGFENFMKQHHIFPQLLRREFLLQHIC